eukprot:12395477-Alexandrium_andersonii.AAC.1
MGSSPSADNTGAPLLLPCARLIGYRSMPKGAGAARSASWGMLTGAGLAGGTSRGATRRHRNT